MRTLKKSVSEAKFKLKNISRFNGRDLSPQKKPGPIKIDKFVASMQNMKRSNTSWCD